MLFILNLVMVRCIRECPGNDAKLIRCILGMTLNSSIVIQGG